MLVSATVSARLTPAVLLAGILCGVLLAPRPALAQSASQLSTWSFEQVLQAAMRGYPSLLGKRAQQRAAQADLEGAKWQRYPSFTAETGAPSDGGSSGTLRVDQTLWSGGAVDAGIASAGSKLDSAGAAIDEERLSLTLRVIAAYTEALRQDGRRLHAARGVDEHRRLLDMIKRRVAHSVSSQTDQLLAESRLYQADNDLSVAEQALRNALSQLSILAGRAVNDVSALGLSAPDLPDNVEALMPQALAFSPTLRRLAYDENTAAADIDAKKAVYMPKVLFRLEKNIGNQLGQNNGARAMLVLQAQPGAGLSAVSGVDAAVASREGARLARADAERSVREQLALDWHDWTGSSQRLHNADAARSTADDVFESYTRQYVAGRKTWNDVLNAVREATAAQLALEDVRAAALAAGLRLAAESGNLRTMDGSRP